MLSNCLLFVILVTTFEPGPLEVKASDDTRDLSSAERSTLETGPTVLDRKKRADDTNPLSEVIAQQAQKLSALEARLQAAENSMTALSNSQGSTFIRWGRTVCPAGTETVYTGVAGGSHYNEEGGPSNRLCLSHNAQFDDAAPLGGYHTNLRGAEYYIPGHDHTDVPCVTCRTSHTSTVMIPGTKTCPQGWTTQYTGHITAAHYTYHGTSEFQCLDSSPEDIEGTGRTSDDGAYFMYTTASCGSLPCPPYVTGKVVTCVVCSK